MISRIEGVLLVVQDGRAQLGCGHVTYEVLIPGADQQRLATMIGQTLSFDTLHYLESQGPTGPFVPRLIGFNCPEDREFFELFTTVKGMGNRKALRALQLPFATVASAIAERDLDLLKSLPEIGKRTAETILAELNGKVERFVELKPAGPLDASDPRTALIADAVGVLAQLGEPRPAARQLVERAIVADPSLDSAESLVAAAFRLKDIG